MEIEIRFPFSNSKLAGFYAQNKGADKNTIIFLHDALGSQSTWKSFPRDLSDALNCNFLVYDRLGHGASDRNNKTLKRSKKYMHEEAQVLLDIIDYLGIQSAILYGHSDGGTIALIAAAQQKDKIKTIIVEAAHVFLETVTLQGIRKMKLAYKNDDLKEKLYKHHGPNTDDLFSLWTDAWLDDKFKDWNIENCLSEVSCPCLIVQGSEDEYGTVEQVTKIANGVSGKVQSVILKNVGHSPHRENKQLIIDKTLNFINQFDIL